MSASCASSSDTEHGAPTASRGTEAADHRALGPSLRRRKNRSIHRRCANGRPDVRGILDPAPAALPLPGGDDPRQLADRHQFHRHAGRPRRLGAIFPAAGLCRLCGRPGGARPLAALVDVAWRGRRRRPHPHRAPLHRPQELRPLAAGQAAHPMAGRRHGRRQALRRVLRHTIPVADRQRDVAADQPRRRGCAAR